MTAHFQPSTKQKIILHSYSLLWLLIIPFALCHFAYQLIRRKPGYTKARLSRYGFTPAQDKDKEKKKLDKKKIHVKRILPLLV